MLLKLVQRHLLVGRLSDFDKGGLEGRMVEDCLSDCVHLGWLQRRRKKKKKKV